MILLISRQKYVLHLHFIYFLSISGLGGRIKFHYDGIATYYLLERNKTNYLKTLRVKMIN